MPIVKLSESERGWYGDTTMNAQRHVQNAQNEAAGQVGRVVVSICKSAKVKPPAPPVKIEIARDEAGIALAFLWGPEWQAFLAGKLEIPGAVVPVMSRPPMRRDPAKPKVPTKTGQVPEEESLAIQTMPDPVVDDEKTDPA